MDLRPYQQQAVESVERAFEEVRSALVVLPTGAGKTIVFANVAAREVMKGGRVLVLAHRGELLHQAQDKILKATGITSGLEKAESTSDMFDEPPYMVVVGSVQSMCRPKRLARFAEDDFSLVIIDECHHALSTTYRTVMDHFPTAAVLGVTATPDRGDLRSLGTVFEKIAFEYTIVQAIRDGYLSPIRAHTIPLKIDLSNVSTVGGDYQASGVGDALSPYLSGICENIARLAADRKTIVFTPLIATSEKMLSHFAELGLGPDRVREVNGSSQDRQETLDWFASAGKGSVLVNSMLLTEGYDEPSVDCIVVLRATKSRALYCQMVGRGTRLSPATGKKNLLLLDFLWLSSSHDLCRPACLMTDDAEVAEEMTRRQEDDAKKGEETDISEEALEDAETETVRKREEALAKKLEAMRRRQGRLVDPLQYAYSVADCDLTNYTPMTDRDAAKPSEEQMKALERMGMGCPECFGAAEKVISALTEREKSGMSTPRQIRQLERRGFRNVGKWTFESARKMIDRIAANGWKTPWNIRPAYYVPEECR